MSLKKNHEGDNIVEEPQFKTYESNKDEEPKKELGIILNNKKYRNARSEKS